MRPSNDPIAAVGNKNVLGCGNFGHCGGLTLRTSYMEGLLFNVGFYSIPLSFNKLN